MLSQDKTACMGEKLTDCQKENVTHLNPRYNNAIDILIFHNFYAFSRYLVLEHSLLRFHIGFALQAKVDSQH